MQKGKSIEQKQLKEINQINEGLFSKFFTKLITPRFRRLLAQAARDPEMRGAIATMTKASEDWATNMESLADEAKMDTSPSRIQKKRIKILKGLGIYPK